jgi:ribonuclease R
VTRFGLFVRLHETGGDGLVPVTSLGNEYFHHDESGHALIGSMSGDRWELGARVEVRLVEAVPVTGGLMFEMVSDPKAGKAPSHKQMRGPMRGATPMRRPSTRPGGVTRRRR